MPGRYITALWPSIGLVATFVHWPVGGVERARREVRARRRTRAVRQQEHERVQRHPARRRRQRRPRVRRRVVDLRQRVDGVGQRRRLAGALSVMLSPETTSDAAVRRASSRSGTSARAPCPVRGARRACPGRRCAVSARPSYALMWPPKIEQAPVGEREWASRRGCARYGTGDERCWSPGPTRGWSSARRRSRRTSSRGRSCISIMCTGTSGHSSGALHWPTTAGSGPGVGDGDRHRGRGRDVAGAVARDGGEGVAARGTPAVFQLTLYGAVVSSAPIARRRRGTSRPRGRRRPRRSPRRPRCR